MKPACIAIGLADPVPFSSPILPSVHQAGAIPTLLHTLSFLHGPSLIPPVSLIARTVQAVSSGAKQFVSCGGLNPGLVGKLLGMEAEEAMEEGEGEEGSQQVQMGYVPEVVADVLAIVSHVARTSEVSGTAKASL